MSKIVASVPLVRGLRWREYSENLYLCKPRGEVICCCSPEILDPSPVSLHTWVASCKPACPCPWLFSHHLIVLLSFPAWLICGFPSLFVTGKCWFPYSCLCGLMPAICFQVSGWFSWINLSYIWLRASWAQAHGNQKVKMVRRSKRMFKNDWSTHSLHFPGCSQKNAFWVISFQITFF